MINPKQESALERYYRPKWKKSLTITGMTCALVVAIALVASADDSKLPPREIGIVKWNRDLKRTRAISASTGKPIFLLFQEVPGCQNCIDFGKGPMSNRLLVEAIESDFVPGLVFNNKLEDQKWLRKFSEPAWNNPVVRMLDSELRDWIPRKDGIWSTGGMAHRMRLTLIAAKRPVPVYLKLLEEQYSGRTEIATFAMHCYWEGEAAFGRVNGVKQTRVAWLKGKEIVNVAFDPQKISYAELIDIGLKARCATTVFTRGPDQQKVASARMKDRAEPVPKTEFGRAAKDSDQKYYLKHSIYYHLPLTDTQQVRINSALGKRESPLAYLSPRQAEMLKYIKSLQREPIQFRELVNDLSAWDFVKRYDYLKAQLKVTKK